MNKGDKIKCKRNDGYPTLTVGKTYTVKQYDPPSPEPGIGFTWPAYVTLEGDTGREVTAHASRFEVIP